jgi:hypothetical protein
VQRERSIRRAAYLLDDFLAVSANERETFVDVRVVQTQEILRVQGTEFLVEFTTPCFHVR